MNIVTINSTFSKRKQKKNFFYVSTQNKTKSRFLGNFSNSTYYLKSLNMFSLIFQVIRYIVLNSLAINEGEQNCV